MPVIPVGLRKGASKAVAKPATKTMTPPPPSPPKPQPKKGKAKKRKVTTQKGPSPPTEVATEQPAKKAKPNAGATPAPFRNYVGPWKDKPLRCLDCAGAFVFTAGQQEVYAAKYARLEPRRCKACDSVFQHGMARKKVMMMSGLCLVCKASTHQFKDCPHGCFNCGQAGHLLAACPEPGRCRDYQMGWCEKKSCKLPHVR